MKDLSIPASSISRNITVNVRVTGWRRFQARWWIAKWLLLAAAWVAGCNINIVTEDTP